MNTRGEMPSEMRALAEEFFTSGDAVVNEFIQGFGNEPAPPRIFHYTNDKGLRGILESGKIWLTDIFCLNDPAELRHGIEHAIELIRSMAENGPPEFKLFATKFSAISSGGIERSAHYFVSCFSKNGDELGQWRAYGDDGRGFALGFDGTRLEQRFAAPNGVAMPNNSTFPVTYDDRMLRTIHEKVIQKLVPFVSEPRGRNLDNYAINAYMKHLSINLSVLVFWVALYFKHEAYVNECEYRFLQIQSGDLTAENVRFRARPYGLVRYTEYDWRSVAPEALKEIIIGPAAERHKSQSYAQDCLDAYGYCTDDVQLRFSNIPYRSARL